MESKQPIDLGLNPGDEIIFALRRSDKKAKILEASGEIVKLQVEGEQFPRLVILEPTGDGRFRRKLGEVNSKLFGVEIIKTKPRATRGFTSIFYFFIIKDPPEVLRHGG